MKAELKIIGPGQPLPFEEGRILTTGCFDIIHAGHARLLEDAASLGPLWVGVNSDAAVRGLKGPGRPINTAYDRAYVIAAFMFVERVFIIDSTIVDKAIKVIRPAAWIKGGDYALDTLNKTEVAAARFVGADIMILPTVGGHSTTRILEKAKNNGNHQLR